MRLIALVIAGCCTAAWLAGGGQPTFRSGVELVTIDVVATDRSGKPVHNLKASDFELFEDGTSQPIRTFQFIDASVAPAAALLPPGIVTNDIDPGGIFALVLDDIGYYVTETREVRREAERFLTTMLQPHDHVVVVRSGVDSGFTLTTDRTRALETALASAGRRDRGLRLEQPGGDTGVGDTPQEF